MAAAGGPVRDSNERNAGDRVERRESPQVPSRRLAEPAPVPVAPPIPRGRTTEERALRAPVEDEGPPLWPDDWDQVVPPPSDDYFGPVQPVSPVSLPGKAPAPKVENERDAPAMGISMPGKSLIQPEPALPLDLVTTRRYGSARITVFSR